MNYYSEIRVCEDGKYSVHEDHKVFHGSKRARYRINIPNQSGYVERVGPYVVEEKIRIRWLKIGVLLALHPSVSDVRFHRGDSP